jgi:CRISPR-associated protein Csx16
VEWAVRQGITIDRTVPHLNPAEIRPGGVVIGALPIHLAAEVCARGPRYLHLVLELTAEDMVRRETRLVA